ncbi:MAG: S1C family serine protease, partial [Ruminococcus sp.]
ISKADSANAMVVEKAAESVVEITTEAVVTGSFSQQYIQQGAGSGVIISEDGYIVTNYHVIEDASQISVTLRNEKEYTKVEIVGIYEAGDIALLKIDSKDSFTPAVFGDSSKLNVGDYAVAIGNPLGQLGGTVTDGIISALDRKVTIDDETMNLLQTNAEISPGNSGGGLFDGNGELIGIVNAKSSQSSSEGLGFAIPINDVVDVLSDLKEYGYVKGQIDLGMSLSDVTSTAQAWMYGANKTGVYVTSVNIGSNAEKAGFQAGDIIQEVNGTKVTSTQEVNDIIKTLKVGDTVTFKVYRNGSTGTLKMKLAEYMPSTFKSSSTQTQDNQRSIWDFFNY